MTCGGIGDKWVQASRLGLRAQLDVVGVAALDSWTVCIKAYGLELSVGFRSRLRA